jgi:hypothetical protein
MYFFLAMVEKKRLLQSSSPGQKHATEKMATINSHNGGVAEKPRK